VTPIINTANQPNAIMIMIFLPIMRNVSL